MGKKYYWIDVKFAFCGYMAKGTYEEAVAFGIKKLQEDFNVHDEDFPTFWSMEYDQIDPKTGKKVHMIEHNIVDNYEDFLEIKEVDMEDFLDMIYSSYEFYDEKGEKWIIEHMDDFFDILGKDGSCEKPHLY